MLGVYVCACESVVRCMSVYECAWVRVGVGVGGCACVVGRSNFRIDKALGKDESKMELSHSRKQFEFKSKIGDSS